MDLSMLKAFHPVKALVSLCILLLSSIGVSGNLNSYLVSTEDFFNQFPAEKVLSDQFSTRASSTPSPIVINQSKPIRIVLVVSSPLDDIENRTFLYSFKKRLQELRINYRLELFPVPPLEDVLLSEHFYGSDVITADYLVFDQLSPTFLPLIERALKTKSPKVILRNVVTPIKSWLNHSPLLYLGVDENKSMDRLASYLARQVPDGAMIDALTVQGNALAQLKCDYFFDALQKRGIRVRQSLEVENTVAEAEKAAAYLLKGMPAPYFIFGCTENMSRGIVEAIRHNPQAIVTTNSWGKDAHEIEWLEQGYVSVIVLPMQDNLAIALAEALKNELNFDLVPKIYIAQTSLLTQDMDSESANLMFQQAYQYASLLWQQE
ncbi:hypothetical protein [Marinomonas mediterranea]|uniref:hypothetical protein n=1 Tax=Marinomonas mediterranea TaxID=119864 RepID=UPI00234BE890|nr:hypothetical protein [Marinomonas mediterranea]